METTMFVKVGGFQSTRSTWLQTKAAQWTRTAALLAALIFPTVAVAQPVPFRHVIIVFQENRTPDNLFGSNPKFEPGVDVASQGINSQNQIIPLRPAPLGSCWDLAHSHEAFVQMYDDGRMDGADRVKVTIPPWARANCPTPAAPQFSYADNSTGQVQPYFDLATGYGFANHFFSQQGPSFPGHQILFGASSAPTPTSDLAASSNMDGDVSQSHQAGCTAPAGVTVQLIDPRGGTRRHHGIYPCLERQTLGDLLDTAGLSWRYYTPFPDSIWTAPNAIKHSCEPRLVHGKQTCVGPDWNRKVVTNPAQVLADIQKCDLPAVSWVIPSAQQSDHAGSNDGTGPQWVASIVNAVGQNPACSGHASGLYWHDTAILVSWDDWGGWYDHVPPPTGAGFYYGFRVPLLVISAYTPAGYVSNSIMNMGAVLRFTEQNFGLPLIGTGVYQDAAFDRPLAGFFTLRAPRVFSPIATGLGADHFRLLKEEMEAPDD